jgi:hypothetical protein
MAAAFVTSVAVVLNPVTPALPDITVPALFPPAAQTRLPAATPPAQPALAMSVPVPVAPVLAVPAVVVAPAVSLADPGVTAGPTAPAPSPARFDPPIEIDTALLESPAAFPAIPPVAHVDGTPIGMAHTGGRPRLAASRQPLRAGGPRPLPAAAEDASDPADPAGDAVTPRGRAGVARPSPGEAAPRGHRGAPQPG